MFGENAIELIKELDRNHGNLPPYNTDLINEVNNEIRILSRGNYEEAAENSVAGQSVAYPPAVKCRHSAILRNRRCLLAYHYNRIRRIRTMRWEFGSVLPPEIKENLSHSEVEWMTKYSKSLAQYMRSVGDEGINLSVNLKPPKSLYVEVRSLMDFGKFELKNGMVLLIKKGSRHFLPRSECEELIRQGVFEHIVD